MVLRLTMIIAVGMSLFQLYTGIFGVLPALSQRGLHILFGAVLVFLIYSAKGEKSKRVGITEIIFILGAIFAFGYVIVNNSFLVTRIPMVSSVTLLQKILAVVAMITILEATRRVMGLAFPMLTLFFLFYYFTGEYWPGFLAFHPVPIDVFFDSQFLTLQGIFGTPAAVSSTYLYLFILFGAFVANTGFGEFLMDFSMSVAGRSRGGPAKIAIISSGLMGMVSGSAVANVVTTGQATIPLMKKIGYKPHFAAAVEAVASSGGQIMPPIMGVAAFLMVEFAGIPYLTIIKYALLPGILYFLSVFLTVDIEAARTGLTGLPKDQLPSLRKAMKKAHLGLPIVVLIIMLMMGYSTGFSVIGALFGTILLSLISKETRLSLQGYIKVLENGARSSLSVVMACACAGIIISIISLSGLGPKFSTIIVTASHGNLFLALVFTMIAGMILGMGLPTSAMYLVQVALIIPALIKLGVPDYVSHLFVVYFAAVGMITPPVCLASYAAAGLAEANPMQTGWTGMKVGIASFIVPFMFAFNQALLLVGPWYIIAQEIVFAVFGIWALATAAQGYFTTRLGFFARIVLFCVAILFMLPNQVITIIPGMIVAIIFILIEVKKKQRIEGKVMV